MQMRRHELTSFWKNSPFYLTPPQATSGWCLLLPGRKKAAIAAPRFWALHCRPNLWPGMQGARLGSKLLMQRDKM